MAQLLEAVLQRFIAPLSIGLIGAAILISLGVWQVQRLDWKRGILTEIETRISSPSAPLPLALSPGEDSYLPVTLDGQLSSEALYVLVSVKRRGAGWRAISALETIDGRRVLVDRGFLPVAEKDASLYAGPITLDGNVHWPDDRNSSTPQNDVTGNIWYARDVSDMADRMGTEPLLIVARNMSPADPIVTPLPVDTSSIPNDHLQYAVTWFSLAAVWLTMTGVWIRRRASGKDL